MSTVGERIKEARRVNGLTQKDAEVLSGCSKGDFSAWETGKIVPRAATLKRLAEALDVSVGYLSGVEPLVAPTPKLAPAPTLAPKLAPAPTPTSAPTPKPSPAPASVPAPTTAPKPTSGSGSGSAPKPAPAASSKGKVCPIFEYFKLRFSPKWMFSENYSRCFDGCAWYNVKAECCGLTADDG